MTLAIVHQFCNAFTVAFSNVKEGVNKE